AETRPIVRIRVRRAPRGFPTIGRTRANYPCGLIFRDRQRLASAPSHRTVSSPIMRLEAVTLHAVSASEMHGTPIGAAPPRTSPTADIEPVPASPQLAWTDP